MSYRVFKGPTHDNSSQYLKRYIDHETITRTNTNTNTNNCVKAIQCSTLNIARYNRLKQVESIINNNNTSYFTGEISEGNYLTNTISSTSGQYMVNQLIYNNHDSMQLNLSKSRTIDNNNENLFIIDPSNIIPTPSCSNLFRLQTPDISYGLTLVNGHHLLPNKPKLCHLR